MRNRDEDVSDQAGDRNSAITMQRARASIAPMTRRRLLTGTGQLALLAAVLPTACIPVINEPWADGSFWDDGQGWTE